MTCDDYGWQSLLPAAVKVVVASETMWQTPASQAESKAIARSVPARQREYQAGRAAARNALGLLGVRNFDLLGGTGRQPVWPPGVVGSLTHTAGYCAAAVARRDDIAALGIDVEVARPLPADIASMICSKEEQRQADSAATTREEGVGLRVVFSAKEAVYKTYFPQTGRFLRFCDVRLTFDVRTCRFVAELGPDVPALLGRRSIAGGYSIRDDFVLTAVALTA